MLNGQPRMASQLSLDPIPPVDVDLEPSAILVLGASSAGRLLKPAVVGPGHEYQESVDGWLKCSRGADQLVEFRSGKGRYMLALNSDQFLGSLVHGKDIDAILTLTAPTMEICARITEEFGSKVSAKTFEGLPVFRPVDAAAAGHEERGGGLAFHAWAANRRCRSLFLAWPLPLARLAGSGCGTGSELG